MRREDLLRGDPVAGAASPEARRLREAHEVLDEIARLRQRSPRPPEDLDRREQRAVRTLANGTTPAVPPP